MKLIRVFILLIIIVLPSGLFSSHVVGGYIQYTWLKNNRYGVEVQIFRDCRGIPLGQSPLKMTFLHSNGSVIGSDTVQNLMRKSITEVTFQCTYKKPLCNPINTTSGEGLEKHIFYTEVDFDSARFKSNFQNSNLCQIIFSWEQCCRAGAITTGQANENFYIQSTLNLCTSGGSKMSWVNTNAIPFFDYPNRFCCNSKQNHFMGAFDTADLDSVAFRLAPAMKASGTSATYASPFSHRIPLTPYCPTGGIKCTPQPTASPPRGFYFDSINCIAIFTPANCQEYAIVAVEIQEFRKVYNKWELVSKSLMEKLLSMDDACNFNYIPKLNIKKPSDTALIGKPYMQFFYSKDDTGSLTKVIDTTTIEILNMPPGGSYIRSSPFRAYDTGAFKWTPTPKWSGKRYKMWVAVFDNKCARPSYELKVLNLYIRPLNNLYNLRTYHDKNANCLRDSNENYVGNVRFVVEGSQPGLDQYVQTNDTGYLKLPIAYGPRKIRFIPNEMYYSNCDSLELGFVKIDTAFNYEIPVQRKTHIRGMLFNDHDSDCVQNNILDVPVEGILVKSDKGHKAWTQKDGSFIIYCDTGNYKLRLPNYVSDSTCGTALKFSSVHVAKDSFANLGKMAVFNRITDLETGMTATRLLRGGTNTVTITVRNNSSNSLATYTGGNYPKLFLKYPKKLTYSSCVGGCSNDTGKAMLSWTLANIENGATATFSANFLADQTKYNVGDNIALNAFLDTSFSDFNNYNNAFGLKITVRGPYDPNIKLSETSDSGVCSENLVYRIDFQNTGTDTAFDVMVSDSLDTAFDINTLVPLSSSSLLQLHTEGQTAKFFFRNHKLPDSSTNLSKSKGYVTFAVKLKDSTDKQITIDNRAYIEFDYEEPVATKAHKYKTIPYTEIIATDKGAYCGESDMKLSYRVNYIATVPKLQLQLSDTSGKFLNPTVIKEWRATPDPEVKSMTLTLPIDLSTSKKYQLRILPISPENHLFVRPSLPFEIVEVSSGFAFNKPEYCDKDSIKLNLSGTATHSVWLNNTAVKTNAFSGNYFIGLASATGKNEVKIVSSNNGCYKTRIINLKANPLPVFNTILIYETVCTDSLSKLSIIGPDRYYVHWKSKLIYDSIPKGVYYIPASTVQDSLLIIARTAAQCVSQRKILGALYEQVLWSAKILDTMVCRGGKSKLTLTGLTSYSVLLGASQIFKNIGNGTFSFNVPFPQESMVISGISSLGCPYTKTLLAPKMSNPNTFSVSLNDDTVCLGITSKLELHDRNYFDIYKNNFLLYPAHDSSSIFLQGDTSTQSLMIIGQTAFGCKDTQYLQTPVLDNWQPIYVSVSEDKICKGDSAKIELRNRENWNILRDGKLIYSGINEGSYYLPDDTIQPWYKVQGISTSGCVDSALVKGPLQEKYSPRLIAPDIVPPFCDGDLIHISYEGSPTCYLYNFDTIYHTMNEFESRSISVHAAHGIKLQAKYKSLLGCDYESGVFTSISNPYPPEPFLSKKADTLFSSAAFYNNWYYFNGAATGDTLRKFIPDSNAAYFVRIIPPSGCIVESDSVHFKKQNISVYFPHSSNNFILKPNPFHQKFELISAIPIHKIRIFSLDGKELQVQRTILSPQHNEVTMTDATPGIYIVEIQSENNVISRFKLVQMQP